LTEGYAECSLWVENNKAFVGQKVMLGSLQLGTRLVGIEQKYRTLVKQSVPVKLRPVNIIIASSLEMSSSVRFFLCMWPSLVLMLTDFQHSKTKNVCFAKKLSK
jgi:hypothetical protein